MDANQWCNGADNAVCIFYNTMCMCMYTEPVQHARCAGRHGCITCLEMRYEISSSVPSSTYFMQSICQHAGSHPPISFQIKKLEQQIWDTVHGVVARCPNWHTCTSLSCHDVMYVPAFRVQAPECWQNQSD